MKREMLRTLKAAAHLLRAPIKKPVPAKANILSSTIIYRESHSIRGGFLVAEKHTVIVKSTTVIFH